MTPAIGVVRDGELEASGAEADTVYQIGSVTKVFTALLLAREVVDGRLTLAARVGELVTELADQSVGEVTVGSLVTHTSGLPRLPPGMWRRSFGPRARDPYADIDEPTLWAALERLSPRETSGPRYSNLGFGLLGAAIARHRGTTYDEAVRERVLAPLGMQQTSSHPAVPRPGHTRRGKAHATAWRFAALAGAGSLWSSVTDMSRFVRAQLDPPADSLGEAIALAQQPLVGSGRTQQAMGWVRISGGDGSLLWHNGGTAGYRSFVGVDVGRQRGVVVLSDSDRSVDRLGFRLARGD